MRRHASSESEAEPADRPASGSTRARPVGRTALAPSRAAAGWISRAARARRSTRAPVLRVGECPCATEAGAGAARRIRVVPPIAGHRPCDGPFIEEASDAADVLVDLDSRRARGRGVDHVVHVPEIPADLVLGSDRRATPPREPWAAFSFARRCGQRVAPRSRAWRSRAVARPSGEKRGTRTWRMRRCRWRGRGGRRITARAACCAWTLPLACRGVAARTPRKPTRPSRPAGSIGRAGSRRWSRGSARVAPRRA